MFSPGANGQMCFRRVIGGKGNAPGRFNHPSGVAVARELLIVSEARGRRLQVLTLAGVPLQVIPFDDYLRGVTADEGRVWVTGTHRGVRDRVHELLLPPRNWRVTCDKTV